MRNVWNLTSVLAFYMSVAEVKDCPEVQVNCHTIVHHCQTSTLTNVGVSLLTNSSEKHQG